VVPPAPKRAPKPFSSISAKKSSDGVAVSVASVLIGGELMVVSSRAPVGVVPACDRPVTVTLSARSAPASSQAACAGGEPCLPTSPRSKLSALSSPNRLGSIW